MRSIPGGSLEQHLPLPASVEDEHGAPEVWKCRLPSSGEVIAIVRSEADARRVCPDMLVLTLAEVAIALEAFGQTTLAAKRTFPGAAITAVHNRSRESTRQLVTTNREAKQTPRPKAKPLSPSGSYQSLSSKMPKGTRYKGESYPASDISARYQEHMTQQRAAAARSQEKISDE